MKELDFILLTKIIRTAVGAKKCAINYNPRINGYDVYIINDDIGEEVFHVYILNYNTEIIDFLSYFAGQYLSRLYTKNDIFPKVDLIYRVSEDFIIEVVEALQLGGYNNVKS